MKHSFPFKIGMNEFFIVGIVHFIGKYRRIYYNSIIPDKGAALGVSGMELTAVYEQDVAGTDLIGGGTDIDGSLSFNKKKQLQIIMPMQLQNGMLKVDHFNRLELEAAAREQVGFLKFAGVLFQYFHKTYFLRKEKVLLQYSITIKHKII
jgi:hypothetical protein